MERNARGAAGWLTSCGMFDNKKKTTMDTREISLPENCKIEKTEDGKIIIEEKEVDSSQIWMVKEVRDNKIILKKRIKFPIYFEECVSVIGMGYLSTLPTEDTAIPLGYKVPMLDLCRLLIFRNTWWTKLRWWPFWSNPDEAKYYPKKKKDGDWEILATYTEKKMFAFPTKEVCEQFIKAFEPLLNRLDILMD